jgi:hypothetical protein
VVARARIKIGNEKSWVLTATALPANIPDIERGKVLSLAAEIQAFTLFISNLFFCKNTA